MTKRRSNFTIPARPGNEALTVPLPTGVSADIRVGEQSGLASVTLTGYGASIVIRERRRGGLQLRARWLPQAIEQASGDRLAVRTSDWGLATRKAIAALEARYQIQTAEGVDAMTGRVRLHQAICAIKRSGLVPGNNKKVQNGYRLVLDLAEAILTENPPLPLHQGHVDRFFEERMRFDEDDLEGQAPEGAFEWPAAFTHRKPLRRVSGRTVQKNLMDLQTALRTLMGSGGPDNGPLLRQEPFLKSVDFGDFEAEARATFTQTRLRLVLDSADRATELMRTEGLERVEDRSDGSRNVRKTLQNVVPGMLRMALYHQFSHPTRPCSWQPVRMEDIASTPEGVVNLINSLRLKGGEPQFSPDAADIWDHGAIVYRWERSKLETERVVPNSEQFAAETRRYRSLRDRFLQERGVESPWLYPSPRDLTKPISDTDMRLLLAKGDEVAREKLRHEGLDPDRWVPLHRHTQWYGYRRLWKTVINRLGWERTSASMYAGDWAPLGRNIADDVYARISPGLLLAVVERIPYAEAVERERTREPHTDPQDLSPLSVESLMDR